MTADRTGDVLDLIDGAIDDWTSADAMRWTPEPAAHTDSNPHTPWENFLHGGALLRFEVGQRITCDGNELVVTEATCDGLSAVLQSESIENPWHYSLSATESAEMSESEPIPSPADEAAHQSRRARRRDRPAWQSPYGPARRRR